MVDAKDLIESSGDFNAGRVAHPSHGTDADRTRMLLDSHLMTRSFHGWREGEKANGKRRGERGERERRI